MGFMVAFRQFDRPRLTTVDERRHVAIGPSGTWWFHLVVSFGVIAWLPYTKMRHILTAPLNIYSANLAPLGASLKNIDFEKTETFGVNSLDGFTWKDLLDLDASHRMRALH